MRCHLDHHVAKKNAKRNITRDAIRNAMRDEEKRAKNFESILMIVGNEKTVTYLIGRHNLITPTKFNAQSVENGYIKMLFTAISPLSQTAVGKVEIKVVDSFHEYI